MAITRQGARSLAYWVSVNAPGIYTELIRLAARQSPTLGDCVGCRRHGLGQDTALEYFTPSLTSVNYAADPGIFIPADAQQVRESLFDPSMTTGTPDIAFTAVDPGTSTPITVDQNALTIPDVPGYTPPPPAGPSWFSNVANYLTTGGGINALLGLGTQVLRTQAAQSNVVAAQTVLNAQTARVMAGGTPAAISYRRDPVTGQVVPVLASSTGAQYPLTHSMLNTLAPNASSLQLTTFLSQYGLWIGAGLVAILFIARR